MEIHVPVQPAEVFSFTPPLIGQITGQISVTNTLLTSWVVMVVLIVFALAATRNMKMVPSGVQNVAEAIIEMLLGLGEQVAGSRAREFLPLVATLFLYIWFSNWIGILPGFGTFEINGQPILRSADSDLSITAAMAIIVFVWVQVTGLRSDTKEFFLKFLRPVPVLEILTEIARPLSLALRLFGNILAGGILVEVMLQIVPPIIPAVFLGLEMFVGVIQALIFAILSLAFLSLAAGHGHSESHGEPEHAGH